MIAGAVLQGIALLVITGRQTLLHKELRTSAWLAGVGGVNHLRYNGVLESTALVANLEAVRVWQISQTGSATRARHSNSVGPWHSRSGRCGGGPLLKTSTSDLWTVWTGVRRRRTLPWQTSVFSWQASRNACRSKLAQLRLFCFSNISNREREDVNKGEQSRHRRCARAG